MSADSIAAVPGRPRRGFLIALSFVLLLVIFGLGELLVFGIVSWLDPATLEGLFPGAEAHRIHGIGHGLVAWMIALTAAAQLWRTEERFAPAVLGLAVLSIYTLGAIVSGTFSGLEVVGIAALGAVVWLHPGRPRARVRPASLTATLLAAPLVIGAVVFAGAELGRQLSGNPADPHVAFGHYAVMAVFAAATASALVVGLSGLPGAALAGWLGVVAASGFGIASIVFPTSTSSLGVPLGIAVVVGALASSAGLVLAARPAPAAAAVELERRPT